MKIFKKLTISGYEIFLIALIILYFGGMLYTNSYLRGALPSTYVDLESNMLATAAFKSANLPIYYLFEFLYGSLGISNEVIKMGIALFCLISIITVLYRIGLLVFNNKIVGILAILLFLFSWLHFAPHFTHSSFIEDSNTDALSYAFLMLAIVYWLKECYVLSSIFMGLSFDCHPILAIGFISVFFVYLLINYKNITLKTIILSLCAFLVVTFPVTFAVIRTALFAVGGTLAGELDPELIWKYIRLLQPGSAFVNIDPRFKYGISLYSSSFLLLLVFYTYGENTRKERLFKLFLLLFVILSWAFFDVFNASYFRMTPFFNLWLFRCMVYGAPIVYILLAGAAIEPILSTKVNKILRICIFLLLCFSVLLIHGEHYTSVWAIHFYLLETAIIYYCYHVLKANKKLTPKFLAINIFVITGALINLYYMALYNKYPHHIAFADLFHWKHVGLFLKTMLYMQFKEIGFYFWNMGFLKWAFLFISCAIIYSQLYASKRTRIIIVTIVLILLLIPGMGRRCFTSNFLPRDYKVSDGSRYDRPLIDWIKNHTLTTDSFLVPPFSLLTWQEAKRPAFYDVNGINVASYNKMFIMTLIERFQILMDIDLNILSEEEIEEIAPIGKYWEHGRVRAFFRERYNHFSEEKILKIKTDYGIKYFVTASEKSYTFPLVYQNEKYKVYKLD